MVAGKTALPHKVETQQQASLYLHLRKYLYILFLVHKRNIRAAFYDGFARIIASFYEKIAVCNLMGKCVRAQHLPYHSVISNNGECSDAILVTVVLF